MSNNFTPGDNFLNTLHLTGDPKLAADAYRAKEISDAIDVIYDKPSSNPKWQMASDEDISKLLKQKGGMSKFMSNAWNAIKGAASSPAGRVIGNVAKGAGRVFLPIGAAMAIGEGAVAGAQLVDALRNQSLVNTEMQNEAMAQQEMQRLITQGFAPREALQMVRGLEVDQPSDYYKSVYGMSTTPQPTVTQQPIQGVAANKPSSVETFINKNANPNVSYVQDPSTGEVVAVPAGENLVMAGDNNNNGNNGNISNNAVSGGGSNNGRLAPIPGMDEQAIQAATQPQSQGSFSPTMSVQNALAQNILSSINRTPEERMRMADQLRQVYEQNMANTMQGDPRYSGTVVTPENPYKADMLGYAGVVDKWNAIARGLGYDIKPTNMTNDLVSLAESQYRAQLANQTGVPYTDYINATSEQRKMQLANAQAQLKAQADMIMQSDANMDKKLEAFVNLEKANKDIEKAIIQEDMQRQREMQVASLKAYADTLVQDVVNKGQLDLEKLKQQDMNEIVKAQGAYLNAFNWAGPETQRLIMTNPEMQKFFFGSVVPPDVFNRAYPTAAQGMGLTQRQMPTININTGM